MKNVIYYVTDPMWIASLNGINVMELTIKKDPRKVNFIFIKRSIPTAFNSFTIIMMMTSLSLFTLSIN